MDIVNQWKEIKTHFRKSFASNLHIVIASVDAEGQPSATPIGSLFLNQDQTGFYFEKFPHKLFEASKANAQVCILGVNSSFWFWIKSLFYGKFNYVPAIKLYGQLGIKRKATDRELQRLKRRMKYVSWLKGSKYLWSDMEMVREITFTKTEIINLGKMTESL